MVVSCSLTVKVMENPFKNQVCIVVECSGQCFRDRLCQHSADDVLSGTCEIYQFRALEARCKDVYCT